MSATHAAGLIDSLTGSLTRTAAGRWNTDPMDTRTQQAAGRRWVLPFLAAIVAVLATLLSSASASAATTATAETRVGASSLVADVLVGPPEHITAGQRLGEELAGPGIVVATGVAANGGPSVLARIKNWSGSEYKFGPNLRIAPFGNRTGHPTGRYPHYHRRVVDGAGETLPGQGIGRHRPWDTKSPDTSFWDRF